MTGARRSAPAVVLSLCLCVAACNVYTDDDTDIDRPPPPAVLQAPPPQAGAAAGGGMITVRAGQTLYGVSREQGVPLRALIDANNLTPPFLLRIGQTLVIPRVLVYTVQPGDSLSGVARRTGVEAATLARLNHLQPPYVLAAGTSLVLPAQPTEVAAAPPRGTRAAGPDHPGGIVAQPLPPPSVLPAPRAAPPGHTPTATVAAPPVEAVPVPEIPPDRPLPPGPVVTAEAAPAATKPPQPASPAKLAPAPVPASAPAASQAANGPPTQPPASPPVPAPAPSPVPKPAPASPPAAEPPPPPPEPESGVKQSAASSAAVAAIVAHHHAPSAPLFYWPVRGRVLSTFGEAAGGTHNDGINVAAPEGTEIDAAESGVVAYSGDELRGFGNLLLIKHADGWVTAYAHAKELLVKKGDHVRRGEPIARVGASGGVDRPQLHFELRQGTKAIDPLDHLPPASGDAG